MDIKKLIRSRKFFFTLVALIGLGYYRYQATEGVIAQRASRKINVSRDEHSISEIGYVYEMRVKTDWWQRTQRVIWWVKVPATNKIWSCSLEGVITTSKEMMQCLWCGKTMQTTRKIITAIS